MGFMMDGLEADAYDRRYGDRILVRRIAAYFRPARRAIAVAAGMIVAYSVLETLRPVLIARGVDRLVEGGTLRLAALIAAGILLAGVLSWAASYLRQRLTSRLVGDVVLRVRVDAFAAVLARDLSFYDEEPAGKIVSRVTSDTEAFAAVVTLTLNLLGQFLLVVLITAVLVAVDWRLALVLLVIAPLVMLSALAFRRVARAMTQRSQRVGARVNALINESVNGIAVAKSFRQEAALYAQFRALNAQSYAVNLRTGLVFSSIFPLLAAVTGLGSVALIYFGGRGVLAGQISPGSWFLFMQAIAVFWFPLTSVASFWSQFQLGLAAGERIFALIDAEPRVRQHAAEPVVRLAGRIEFEHVDFRYTAQESVLEDFSLTIAAGETVALVGHTGAGKSTLGKLIARFYEFDAGRILIDGRDIRTLDLAAYRRRLGVVGQLPRLFSGTVGENIRYGTPGATDAAVLAAARQIGGGDWLDALPNGLAADVGEGGRSLSTGQRQLIALARLLLRDPDIVILDEATASVDPLTEVQIQEGLDLVLRDRTAVVIAHRLSTVERADRIIVLRDGRIVEEGDHAALLRAGGHYADLYNTYFRHQSAAYQPGEGFIATPAGQPAG